MTTTTSTIKHSTTINKSNQINSNISEKEKMLTGKPYLAITDKQLIKERIRSKILIQRYNTYDLSKNELNLNLDLDLDLDNLDYFGPDERRLILSELFNLKLDDIKHLPIEIEPPFFCDYGTNIIFKGPFYCNFNCHILDCATVTFGSRVMLGPNVQIYAGTHSTDVSERQKGLERAYPISIGDDVWIGGGAIVIGPCTIGNGTTIAAGAVVRGDIPANVVAAGVPARIVKQLNNSKSDLSNIKTSSVQNSKLNLNLKSIGTKVIINPTGVSSTEQDHNSSLRSEEEEVEEEVNDDPSTECFLANIPNNLSSSTLENALEVFGQVKSLTMDRARRLGFVRFSTPQAAQDAVEAGHGPDGLVVMVNEETNVRMVVGIEHRRLSDSNRTFNPNLITSTRCLIRRLPNTVDFEGLRLRIEEIAGTLVEWNVQDFTSPDPTKPSVDKFISLEFERLCGAREAVRLSQSVDGGLGGIDVPGSEGLKARIEARKQFSTSSGYRNNFRGGLNHHQYHSYNHRSNRGSSYSGTSYYHSSRGNSNHPHYHSNTSHYHSPSKPHPPPFNGSFSKWKPRRSHSTALVNSE